MDRGGPGDQQHGGLGERRQVSPDKWRPVRSPHRCRWSSSLDLVDDRRYGVTEGDIDAVLAVLGPLLPDVDVAVELRDPDDTPVIAAALASRASAIVTGDRDLLDDENVIAWLAARGIAVMTSAEVLAVLRR